MTGASAEPSRAKSQLRVDEPTTGYRDHNSVIGQLLTAKNSPDPTNPGELPPFATPYLTLVCPHPGWGASAGGYASDFLSAQRLNSRGKPVAGLLAEAKLEDAQRLGRACRPEDAAR